MEIISSYSFLEGFVHVVLAILLFYLVNWLGRHAPERDYMPLSLIVREGSMPAFNFVFKILTPIAAYVLLIVLFQSITCLQFLLNKCYFIVVDYWLFRGGYILVTGRAKLMNWPLYIVYASLSIGLSLWLFSLLEKVTEFLPDPRSLVDQLWILMIIFIYQLINNLTINRESTEKRKRDYIISRYKKFNQKYGEYISSQCKDIVEEVAIYSIMIYENFNRPKIIRWVENMSFYITKKKHTLGIMQVTTNKLINDDTSVSLATTKICNDWKEIISQCNHPKGRIIYQIDDLAECYNGGDSSYANEICEIYELIIENEYPQYKEDTVEDYIKRVSNKKER